LTRRFHRVVLALHFWDAIKIKDAVQFQRIKAGQVKIEPIGFKLAQFQR
jgi:hypothetical protein